MPDPPVGVAVRVPTLAEQAALVALAVAGASALAIGHGVVAAWALIPTGALSLVWRLRTAPSPVIRLARALVRILVAVVVLTGFTASVYPFLDDPHVARIGVVLGTILLPLTALALLATPVLPAATGAAPLAIALVAAASFSPFARIGLFQAAAAVAGFLYLATSARRVRAPLARGTLRRALVTVAFACAVLGIALGIRTFLPWAQPRVEDATANMLNPSLATARGGFSDSSRLGDIEQLALSHTVVMRVWTQAPRRLRGRVLTSFDGRTWRAPRPAWREVPRAASGLPGGLDDWLGRMPGTSFAVGGDPGALAVRTRIVQSTVIGDALLAPGGVGVVRIESAGLRRDRLGVFALPPDASDTYAIVHGVEGGAVSAADDAGDDAAFLALPPDTDARLVALAARLAEGAPTAEARIARTLDHLERECRYALAVGPFRTRQPVAEFVFEKKRGWCEYFASAAAVLLRLQGVPARYVAGFSMAGAPRVGSHYLVRESDAHAWIEAYVPGRGWIEADPTPAADYAAVHEGLQEGWLARALDAVRAFFADLSMSFRMADAREILRAVGAALRAPSVAGPLVVLAATAVWWRWRRRALGAARVPPRAENALDPEVAALVIRLERLWARRGCPRPVHRAPLEHLQASADRLDGPARDVSHAVVDCLYRTRYAGVRPPERELADLARRLESIRA